MHTLLHAQHASRSRRWPRWPLLSRCAACACCWPCGWSHCHLTDPCACCWPCGWSHRHLTDPCARCWPCGWSQRHLTDPCARCWPCGWNQRHLTDPCASCLPAQPVLRPRRQSTLVPAGASSPRPSLQPYPALPSLPTAAKPCTWPNPCARSCLPRGLARTHRVTHRRRWWPVGGLAPGRGGSALATCKQGLQAGGRDGSGLWGGSAWAREEGRLEADGRGKVSLGGRLRGLRSGLEALLPAHVCVCVCVRVRVYK